MGMQISMTSAGSSIIPISREFERPKTSVDVRELQATLPGAARANPEAIMAAAENLQKISLAFDRRLQFVIDNETKQILIKVIDAETDNVIKVLPPEELQRLHSRIRESLGLLFDEEA